jgi:hypothetical protein
MKNFLTTVNLACGLAACFISCSLAVAATNKPAFSPLNLPYPRDPKALQVLGLSVSQMGGLDQIRSIRSWEASGAESSPGDASANTVQWLISAGEMRRESTGGSQTTVFTTGQGHPAVQNSAGTRVLPPHVVRATFVPTLVAKYLEQRIDDKNYSLEYLGTDSAGEVMVRTVSHASLVDLAVTSQTWYFDSATNLPLRVSFRLPDLKDPNKFGVATVSLTDYRSVDGVSVPFSHSLSLGTSVFKTTQLNAVQLNPAISDAEFAPLPGANQ